MILILCIVFIFTLNRYNVFVYQSIIVFCPKVGIPLQTQHYPLYSLLSLPVRICIQSISHDLLYYLISSSAANLLPILLHIHISNASNRFCSFRRSVQSLHHIMLYSTQNTSLASSLVLFPRVSRKCLSSC